MGKSQPNQYTRLLLGVLIAPAVVPLSLLILAALAPVVPAGLILIDFTAVAQTIPQVAARSYLCMAILCCPLVLLQRKGWLNLGTVMALTVALAAAHEVAGRVMPPGELYYAIGGVSLTPIIMLSGVCFHLVGVRKYERVEGYAVIISVLSVWLAYLASIGIQYYNFATDDPMADTGSALGVLSIATSGFVLSVGATVVLFGIWLAFHPLNQRAAVP